MRMIEYLVFVPIFGYCYWLLGFFTYSFLTEVTPSLSLYHWVLVVDVIVHAVSVIDAVADAGLLMLGCSCCAVDIHTTASLLKEDEEVQRCLQQ